MSKSKLLSTNMSAKHFRVGTTVYSDWLIQKYASQCKRCQKAHSQAANSTEVVGGFSFESSQQKTLNIT